MKPSKPAELHRSILQYYQSTEEISRLQRIENELELLRTRDILARFLPPAPAEILDVGGGPAIHSFWLTELGYRTHLVDIVPKHIEAGRRIERELDLPLASLTIGDARELHFPDHSVDAVVLLGPLYHLLRRMDRIQTLKEAFRVLKPGGTLIAQGISRYSALTKVLTRQLLDDPRMVSVAHRTTYTGRHQPEPEMDFFTTAYFHLPRELREEIVRCGFKRCRLLSVEGPARLIGQDFDQYWRDPLIRQWLLDMARSLESDPHLLGMSGHMMAIASKPETFSA